MMTLDRKNNFDLIRFFAALQVAIFHGVGHFNTHVSGIWTYIMHFMSWLPDVPIFFFISGFLITASYERNSDLKSYFVNRALRIFPGLWLCFFVGWLSVFLSGYFKTVDHISLIEWFKWIVAQLSIGQFYHPSFLKEYGIGALNGSLWSIPVELQFYIALPILLALSLQMGRIVLYMLAFISLGGAFWLGSHPEMSEVIWYKLFKVTLLPYFYMFFLGILSYQYFAVLRPYVQGKFIYWLLIFIAVCLGVEATGGVVGGNHPNPIVLVVYPMLILSLAYSSPNLSEKLLKGVDLSYGIYIYHALIINYFVYKQYSFNYMFSLYVLLTLVMAYSSFRWIEKPALGLKRCFK